MKNLVILVVVVSIAYVLFVSQKPSQLINPISSSSNAVINKNENGNDSFTVIGFLPSWILNNTSVPASVDTVMYFAISLDESGHVIRNDSGYQRLAAAKKLTGSKKFHLVIKPFSQTALRMLFENESARKTAATEIMDMVTEFAVDGINLDFEPTTPLPDLRPAFNHFITLLIDTSPTMSPPMAISIDVYANAATIPNIWDLEYLAGLPITIIMMAYDYHRSGSTLAGPIAPLYSQDNASITSHLADLLKVVPKEKIVLGLPLYGYQWQVTFGTNHIYPNTAKAVHHKDVGALLERYSAKTHWDPLSLSPYAFYEVRGKKYYLAYETTQSLRFKQELARTASLSGLAYWAIGFAIPTDPVWLVDSLSN